MRTIRWADARYTTESGNTHIDDVEVVIRPQDIQRWQEDPDGRFKMVALDDNKAQLGRFFPSL